MRTAVRILAMIGWLLALLMLHGSYRLAGLRSPWPRHFLGGIARIAGARVIVRGEPVYARVLYLANHLSWLDIMVLAGATGTAFVSKAEVARWPLFGWLAGLNNTIFIARSDRKGVRQQADALGAALIGGQPVTLFPEGTTSGGTALLPFNASLLSAVTPPPGDVRIQPVAIDYGKAMGEIAWGEEAASTNVLRVLGRRGRFDVSLAFLEPLQDTGDRKHVATAARTAIAGALAASGSPVHTL